MDTDNSFARWESAEGACVDLGLNGGYRFDTLDGVTAAVHITEECAVAARTAAMFNTGTGTYLCAVPHTKISDCPHTGLIVAVMLANGKANL